MVKTITPPKDTPPLPPTGIEDVPLREALEERYLAYALSTIMHRALPDARDGLKPVHRRLMYAMRMLKLDPTDAFKKCARIVGDVIGKYHPHGDQSVYDALVRLAQDFAQRYPLVDGQGNFGNIDGDNAAAYRYTEARLTEVAALLLQGIDEDSVDFRATYNDEDEEPVVLPAAFPNMLANGAQGIAVGMATSIPPHNAAELCDAALHLIAHPKATSDDLLPLVPGPDFPTGGVIVEPPVSIAEIYRTGRGGVRLRARWEKEEQTRGNWVIVITEIPWLVQKSRLIEKLADLINEKKLPLVNDVRDESAEDVRVVIEPKNRTVDPAILMETLFKLTELETRIPVNMNVLTDGQVPRVVGLAEALKLWLAHRRVVLQRRSRYRLAQIDKRLEILGGLIIAFLNLDEVIRIVREEDNPKQELMRVFSISDVQANAILDTRLRNLAKLEEMELRRENDELTREKAGIEALLASEDLQWKTISWEIKEVRKKFGPDTPLGRRRSLFSIAPNASEMELAEALVEREPITVVLSTKGWIRTLKGHVSDLSNVSWKGDDSLALSFQTETTARLLLISSTGKAFVLEASKLPGGRGFGDPLRLMIDLEPEAEILRLAPYDAAQKFIVVADDTRGFIIASDEMFANTRKGKQIFTLDGNKLVKVIVVQGDTVAVVGENRKLLCFPLSQLPEMARGKGIRLQKYKDGGLSDITTFVLDTGLAWQDTAGRNFGLKMPELQEWMGNRAEAGRLVPRGFPKSGQF